jgi:hypothetical protein
MVWFGVTGILLLPLTGAILAGCGKGGLSVHDSGAFKSAPPELKTSWDLAVAAAKTNGYALAYSTLETLRTQTNLDAGQTKAVEELIGIVGTRVFNAANSGDPEATKALKEIQSITKRR